MAKLGSTSELPVKVNEEYSPPPEREDTEVSTHPVTSTQQDPQTSQDEVSDDDEGHLAKESTQTNGLLPDDDPNPQRPSHTVDNESLGDDASDLTTTADHERSPDDVSELDEGMETNSSERKAVDDDSTNQKWSSYAKDSSQEKKLEKALSSKLPSSRRRSQDEQEMQGKDINESVLSCKANETKSPNDKELNLRKPSDKPPLPAETPQGKLVDEGMELKKELGLLEGVTIIMGIVIGSGIFVSPKGVILYTGSVGASLTVWAITGVVTMLGALCFAELGTMIPESGGMYSYLHEAFGSLPAFLYMWVTVFIRHSAGSAAVALTFSNYLLQPFFPGCAALPDIPVRFIAAAVICFLSWINCENVKWVAKTQNFFTATKVVALVIIIVAGISHLAWGHIDNYTDPLHGTILQPASLAMAFYQSLFSYSGWENLYFVVEEMKNPDRNLPLAIIIATSLVTVIYTLANVAYLAVLNPTEMLASNAVAMSFAERTLGVMAWMMPVFVMCSTFGGTNGAVFTQARLIFVGARRGQFPRAFSLIHKDNFTPVPAIILNGVLTLLMLVTSDVGLLINYSTFAMTLTQFACICALFWFRIKEPDRKRPFKVWLVLPILFFLTLLFLLVMPVLAEPVDVGIAIGVICSGLPLYYLTIHRQDIAHKLSPVMDKLTYVCQLMFFSLPEEKEE